LTRRIDML